jgi:hypothetical protein
MAGSEILVIDPTEFFFDRDLSVNFRIQEFVLQSVEQISDSA